MKKSLLLLLILPLFSFAQEIIKMNKSFIEQPIKKMNPKAVLKSLPIWSDDFSDASTWVIDHDASACDLDWQIGTGLVATGGAAIATIASTTYDNGCAMIDSDVYGGAVGGSEIEDSWFTTANSIDLSTNTNVVLEFETWYKAYNLGG